MEQDDEVVIMEECQSQDLGSMLACGERYLFSQEELSDSHLGALSTLQLRRTSLWHLLVPRRSKMLFIPCHWIRQRRLKTPSANLWTSKRDQWTRFTLLAMDSLSLGKTPGSGLYNNSPASLSNVARMLVTMFRRLSV